MWNDGQETVVAGKGQVYVAPVGTTVPTSESASLNAAFSGLGFHTDDGVSTNFTRELLRIRAWQSRSDIRREVESTTFQLTFALQQWTEVNVPFAFGGGEVIPGTGGSVRYNPPLPEDGLEEKSLICDVQDGDGILRFIIPKGNVVEGVESQFARSQASALPVTFEALEPDEGGLDWYLYSNLSGFAVGS